MATEKYGPTIGILTVSDRCYQGTAVDKSGPGLAELLQQYSVKQILAGCTVVVQACVPDEVQDIKTILLEWSDVKKLDLILTTGGTGFADRDVTPEATKAVLDKEAPGMTLVMLRGSLDITPYAMLSRPAAGIRGSSLIINLPGSHKAALECLDMVSPALQHALDLLGDRQARVSNTHKQVQAQQGATSLPGGQNRHTCSHQKGPHKPHHHASHQQQQQDVSQVARRARHSPYPMISVETALGMVLQEADVLLTEDVPYNESLGRIVSEDVYAADALPPFPASIKDGYAVLASDGAGDRQVLGDSTAGQADVSTMVVPGVCVRISTGAALPPGADAVVQVEDTELLKEGDDGKTELEIRITTVPSKGQDIRPVGSDIASGACVLSKLQHIGPAEVGLLATVGVTQVQCYKLPRIGIMSTGNELVEPGCPLSSGKIRDSNRAALIATFQEHGFPVIDLGIATDTVSSLKDELLSAMSRADIVVTSGGVSMGEMDLIRPVLQETFQTEIKFGRVHMKPGKPTTFAVLKHEGEKKLFFGLPGNPVSAIVTCNLYVIPAVRKMAGHVNYHNTCIKAKLTDDIYLDPRPEYYRCSLSWQDSQDGIPQAAGTGSQMSCRLLSMRSANALLVLPARTEQTPSLTRGTLVNAIIIGRI